jgi:hypothetical protein
MARFVEGFAPPEMQWSTVISSTSKRARFWRVHSSMILR